MSIDSSRLGAYEALRLDEGSVVPFADLVQISGLTEDVLRELIDYGTILPIDARAPVWNFSASHVFIARRAGRLRHELELDAHAVAIVLSYAERVDALEEELSRVRARLPRRF